MLTVEQSRAARALLGWTQDDLAHHSGISKTSINNYERGLSNPKGTSLQQLRECFEGSGIEFLGSQGVTRRHDIVNVLRGPDAGVQLWNDIIDTLKDSGGEVLIMSVNESKAMAQSPDAFNAHMQNLKKYNITERLLALEGDTHFVQPRECYRWISSELFTAMMPTFIYGNKVAFKLWNQGIIIQIQSNDAAQSEKQRFEYIWANAKTPPAETF